MKKAVLSTLSASILGLLSTQAQSENLLEVYQLAAQNDPLIQEAKANYQSALKGLDIAESALLPQINAEVSYNDSDTERTDNISDSSIDTDPSRTSYGISLTQEIYHHDTWLELSKTEKTVKQAQLVFQTEEQDLIVRTVQAYLNVLSARDDEEFAKAEKQAIERQLEQTKQRFAVGLTAITDVHEAQAQFDNAVAEEILAENTVIIALEDLRAITGQYVETLSELNTKIFEAKRPSPISIGEWIDIAKQQSKELAIRRLGKDIAMEEIDIATAGHYPTADFTAGYKHEEIESNGFSGFSDYEDDGLSWGISISVPIFTGGRTSARVEQSRHAYVAASQQLELSYRVTERNVRSSFNQINATISRINAFEQTVVSAESALKATEAGFEVGTRTIVDVLNSTRNLFDAKRNLANARYNYILSYLTLKQSSGNLAFTDLQTLNRFLSNT